MFRCRILYCIALSAAILFFIFHNGYIAFFTLTFVILLPFVSLIFLLLAIWKTKLMLEIKSSAVNKNEDFIINIKFKNAFVLPIPRIRLKLFYTNLLLGDKKNKTLSFPIDSGNEQVIEYRIQSKYCGKILVKLTQIQYYDYLGIFSVKTKPNIESNVFVIPDIFFIDAEIDTAVDADFENSTYSKEKPGNDSSEIFDIRPYRIGDSMRSIHWKLSSKLDDLMVREYSSPNDKEVVLLIELFAQSLEEIDTIIETFASISHFLLQNNIKHRIQWFDIRNNRFNSETINSYEDLDILLNIVLSGRYYIDKPYVLNSLDKSKIAADYLHAIYITGQLTNKLTGFFSKPNEKITVLYIQDKRQEIVKRLKEMDITAVRIQPGEVQGSLSGLTL